MESVSRRRFITVAGLTAATTSVASNVPARSDEAESEAICGVLHEISDSAWHLDTDQDHRVELRFAPGASFNRNGEPSPLAFELGDEVVGEGVWLSPSMVFLASEVTIAYRRRDGIVVDRSAEWLETTAGPIKIGSFTEARGGWHQEARPPSEIRVGDYVSSLGQYDAETNTLKALQIGVYSLQLS